MQEIFRNSGLPEDLAYLPHVESSFNPKAYSKFGAAGVWQFTRSTGRHYMAVGYTIDERRDPIISSHAAAKLLRTNYNEKKAAMKPSSRDIAADYSNLLPEIFILNF